MSEPKEGGPPAFESALDPVIYLTRCFRQLTEERNKATRQRDECCACTREVIQQRDEARAAHDCIRELVEKVIKERDEARRVAEVWRDTAWPTTETRPPLPWEGSDDD